MNHKPEYKNGYVTKTMCIEAGAQAVRYTTSRGYAIVNLIPHYPPPGPMRGFDKGIDESGQC